MKNKGKNTLNLPVTITTRGGSPALCLHVCTNPLPRLFSHAISCNTKINNRYLLPFSKTAKVSLKCFSWMILVNKGWKPALLLPKLASHWHISNYLTNCFLSFHNINFIIECPLLLTPYVLLIKIAISIHSLLRIRNYYEK